MTKHYVMFDYDVVDNLASTATDKPLSANMGKELEDTKQDISNLVTSWSAPVSDTKYPSEKLVSEGLALKEDLSNKVTSFQATPDDTHYPSEKLVKDQLDLKQDKLSGTAGNVVTYTSTAGTVGSLGIDTTPTASSTNLITSGAVYSRVRSGTSAPSGTGNTGDIYIQYSA